MKIATLSISWETMRLKHKKGKEKTIFHSHENSKISILSTKLIRTLKTHSPQAEYILLHCYNDL